MEKPEAISRCHAGDSEEQKAIRRCRAGDMEALGVLFELHHQAVFRTAYGIVHRQDLADDVTQVVFIELLNAIKRYDLRRPFAPWLHGITVHRSLDELKPHRNRNLPIEDVLNLPSTAPSPEKVAEDSEVEEAVRRAIWKLEPKHRAAIVLRYYQGFTEAEMAQALRCRRGTVKSRLNTARGRLCRILQARASPITAFWESRPARPRSGGANASAVCAFNPYRAEEKL